MTCFKKISFFIFWLWLFSGFGLAVKPVRGQSGSDWYMAGANPQRTSWVESTSGNQTEIAGKLKPLWYRPIEPYISQNVQLVVTLDKVFVSTARGLYALYTGDDSHSQGQVAWVYPTEMPLGHSPTVYNNRVYVGGLDHKIHCLDADNGQKIWEYEAMASNQRAGFYTSPLVVEIDSQTVIFAGNRDGYMYALKDNGSSASLYWSAPFKTGGPVLFSAAISKDKNRLFFASNDSHAYALNPRTGSQLWKSGKLPGSGFHSWWPVVYTHPSSGKEYVVFAGSNNYRQSLDPGPGSDIQGLEINDLYAANGIAIGDNIGSLNSTTGELDASLAVDYFNQKPWRRTYFVLDANSGAQDTNVPITWQLTHGAGNRYPPVAAANGLLYQPMHYNYSISSISGGSIVGWKPGSATVWTSGQGIVIDEPVAISSGGNLIYKNHNCDRRGGSFNINTQPDSGKLYFVEGDSSSGLEHILPGYDHLYELSPQMTYDCAVYKGNRSSLNGIYGQHGEQNAPVPYKGKLYSHRSNSIVVFANHSGDYQTYPLEPTQEVANANISLPSKDELENRLEEEVQKILSAGHLRPGFLGHGLFDQRSSQKAGEYVIDYFHHPSEVFYALSLAARHLPGKKTEIGQYLEREYNDYPYYEYTHIGWKDGGGREAFDLPSEVENDRVNSPPDREWESFYGGWWYPPQMFYHLWAYAKEFGGAKNILDDCLNHSSCRRWRDYQPADSRFTDWPQDLNAWIAGYTGYLELEKLAGYSETTAIRSELNHLLSLRASSFDKDMPWTETNDFRRALNVARNFMFLTPELGDYLRDNAYSKVNSAFIEYDSLAPYWFVTKTEQAMCEGVISLLWDYHAMFSAKAYFYGANRAELYKYLDVPAFERGDLFYIQNLVATIEAPSSGPEPPTSTPRPTSPQPTNTPTPDPACDFDLDGSGVVGPTDLLITLSNWSDSFDLGAVISFWGSVCDSN